MMSTAEAPAKPRKAADQETGKAARKAQNNRIRAILRARWPHLFGYARPLAIGIGEPLLAAVGDEIGKAELDGFLRFWCRRTAYRAALERPGARRLNLDGSDAGPADVGDRINRMTAAILRLAAKRGDSTEEQMRAAALERDPEASAELVGMAIRRAVAQLQRRAEPPAPEEAVAAQLP